MFLGKLRSLKCCLKQKTLLKKPEKSTTKWYLQLIIQLFHSKRCKAQNFGAEEVLGRCQSDWFFVAGKESGPLRTKFRCWEGVRVNNILMLRRCEVVPLSTEIRRWGVRGERLVFWCLKGVKWLPTNTIFNGRSSGKVDYFCWKFSPNIWAYGEFKPSNFSIINYN